MVKKRVTKTHKPKVKSISTKPRIKQEQQEQKLTVHQMWDLLPSAKRDFIFSVLELSRDQRRAFEYRPWIALSLWFRKAVKRLFKDVTFASRIEEAYLKSITPKEESHAA